MPEIDLADPAFEPTDADFQRLLHAAGEDARAARQQAKSRLRELMMEARKEVAERTAGGRPR